MMNIDELDDKFHELYRNKNIILNKKAKTYEESLLFSDVDNFKKINDVEVHEKMVTISNLVGSTIARINNQSTTYKDKPGELNSIKTKISNFLIECENYSSNLHKEANLCYDTYNEEFENVSKKVSDAEKSFSIYRFRYISAKNELEGLKKPSLVSKPTDENDPLYVTKKEAYRNYQKKLGEYNKNVNDCNRELKACLERCNSEFTKLNNLIPTLEEMLDKYGLKKQEIN